MDVGITMYSTVPTEVRLGFESDCVILFPVPGAAPVTPPVTLPMVQVNELGTVAESGIFVFVPVQTLAVAGVVTAGVGLTVTDVDTEQVVGYVKKIRAFPPAIPVTVPVASTEAIPGDPELQFPEPGPLERAVVSPWQIVVIPEIVAGLGLTVTVIGYAGPAHEPDTDVGITIYSTVPVEELPGLFNTWLITEPEPEEAPVMLPVTVPMLQVKLLGNVAARVIFVEAPLHIIALFAVVTDGTP